MRRRWQELAIVAVLTLALLVNLLHIGCYVQGAFSLAIDLRRFESLVGNQAIIIAALSLLLTGWLDSLE